jgi:hypothetical protein
MSETNELPESVKVGGITERGDELRFEERAKPFAEKFRFANYREFIQRVGSDSGLAMTVVEELLKEKYAEEEAKQPLEEEPKQEEHAAE